MIAALGMLCAIAAIFGIFATISPRGSVAYHLARIKYMRGHYPPLSANPFALLKTLRWYLEGRPTRVEWSHRIEEQERALLSNGYFVQRQFGLTDKRVLPVLWQVVKRSPVAQRPFEMDLLSNSVLLVTACTSDIPTFATLIKRVERERSQTKR